MSAELVTSKNFSVPEMHRIETAIKHGAYSSLERLSAMEPSVIVEEVKASGLRGRGGAGFPTGIKWGFIPKDRKGPVYLVVNADESEPGTFKDRSILENDPHLLIEGIVIAAKAIGAKKVFAYFRGEYARQWRRFTGAVHEALSHGFIGGDVEIVAHRGAGAYVCGEETALLNSIEGYRGLPRIKPPFPAVCGLFGEPTIINNVETLSSLPFIINKGAAVFRRLGTNESPGTKLISVCGHVERPGVYEVEMGLPVARFLADFAGGTLGSMKLKALIPGGTSVPVLKASEALAATIDFESFARCGSMLGSGGMIVICEGTCMVRVLSDIAEFYAHESCGQCTPCREGTGWIRDILYKIEGGLGESGDIELLNDIAGSMPGRTVCVLADALAMPVKSFIAKFRDEFEKHISSGHV